MCHIIHTYDTYHMIHGRIMHTYVTCIHTYIRIYIHKHTHMNMQSELAEARLALKAASKVETDLTIKAASFTGKRLFFLAVLIFF